MQFDRLLHYLQWKKKIKKQGQSKSVLDHVCKTTAQDLEIMPQQNVCYVCTLSVVNFQGDTLFSKLDPTS